MMMRIIPIALLAVSVIACQPQSGTDGGPQTAATDGLISETISIDAFEQKLAGTPDAQLIDVRTPGEFAQGHLTNAVNINIGSPSFSSAISNLDKEKPVFVYCLTGVRSRRAAQQLHQQGFKVVYDMQGGVMKWHRAGKAL